MSDETTNSTQAAAPNMTTPRGKEIGAKLLDRANDVSEFCSKDETRYVIQGIHLAEHGVEASDGAIAIRVPYSGIEAAEFPPVKTPDTLAEAILPAKALREALKTLPARTTLPVLSTVKVASNGDDKIQLATSDLDNDRVISTKRIDGNYPQLESVWPKDEPKFSISLNADLLSVIADYALKHGKETATSQRKEHAVRFGFTDELSPVCFSLMLEDGRKVEGLLMPMRMS